MSKVKKIMCNKKNININNDSAMETDSDSDISISDDEESMDEENITIKSSSDEEIAPSEDEEKSSDEDEVIKAIIRESEHKNDHPPIIQCDDYITDISFHPFNDILAVANIVGDVTFYSYNNEENTIKSTLELHTKSCRDIEFSHDGMILFSTSKDKAIMLSDADSGQLIRFYENAHEQPVNCLTVIDNDLFATGDDDGTVKLWDKRQNSDRPIYKTKKNEDYISDMATNEANKYLLCSSGDGSLTSIDLVNRRIFMQSEEIDDELTCLGIFRHETKLVAGSTRGKLYLYNWNEFGLQSDAFPGPKSAINSLVPVTENILITAGEDGKLRATHLFPHRHLGIVGQHEMSVENVDISNNGKIIASTGHNNEIKFWNIEYFESMEKVSHKHKKHERKLELEKNLPSSKMKNVSDFFNDLADDGA